VFFGEKRRFGKWRKIHKLSSVKNSEMSFTLAHIPLLRNGGKEKKRRKKKFPIRQQDFCSLWPVESRSECLISGLSFAYFQSTVGYFGISPLARELLRALSRRDSKINALDSTHSAFQKPTEPGRVNRKKRCKNLFAVYNNMEIHAQRSTTVSGRLSRR
jgi:hypothetical protein